MKIPRYLFCANLVIAAEIYYKLSHGKAKFPQNLSQNGQNDLEGQMISIFNTNRSSIPQCMFGENSVILAQICYSYHVDKVKFTDRQTDVWMEHPFILKGEGVKMVFCFQYISICS